MRVKGRIQNSQLYYTGIEILGSYLFLQSIIANLHENICKTTMATVTTMIMMPKDDVNDIDDEKQQQQNCQKHDDTETK